jgi:hypothetical protein
MGGACRSCERYEIHIKCRSQNLKERDHLGNLSIGGRIILKRIIQKRT